MGFGHSRTHEEEFFLVHQFVLQLVEVVIELVAVDVVLFFLVVAGRAGGWSQERAVASLSGNSRPGHNARGKVFE